MIIYSLTLSDSGIHARTLLSVFLSREMFRSLVVLVTDPDRRFRSGSRSELNRWQIDGPGLSIHPNRQRGYSLIVNTQPVGIGPVVSASPYWVHLLIHIWFLFLQFIYHILPKSCIRQSMIRVCMLCSLQSRFIWNPCFSCYSLYFWL